MGHVRRELEGGATALVDALQSAYDSTVGEGVMGSSTVCLVDVDLVGGGALEAPFSLGIRPLSPMKSPILSPQDTGAVQSANIGDSGFIILGVMPEDMGQAPGVRCPTS